MSFNVNNKPANQAGFAFYLKVLLIICKLDIINTCY